MTAKQLALKDIQDELQREHKQFIPFIKKLNPAIRKIVNTQLRKQGLRIPLRPNAQLIAHCFFSKSHEVQYNNYSNYYEQ